MAPSGTSTPTPSRAIEVLYAAPASEPAADPVSSTLPIEALSLSIIMTAPVEVIALPISDPMEEVPPAVVEALVKPVFTISLS
jgi:hypothetical protein